MRKIGAPADTTTEFEFGDTVAYIQKRREEREQREREREGGGVTSATEGREGGKKPGRKKLHTQQRRVAEKELRGVTVKLT